MECKYPLLNAGDGLSSHPLEGCWQPKGASCLTQSPHTLQVTPPPPIHSGPRPIKACPPCTTLKEPCRSSMATPSFLWDQRRPLFCLIAAQIPPLRLVMVFLLEQIIKVDTTVPDLLWLSIESLLRMRGSAGQANRAKTCWGAEGQGACRNGWTGCKPIHSQGYPLPHYIVQHFHGDGRYVYGTSKWARCKVNRMPETTNLFQKGCGNDGLS